MNFADILQWMDLKKKTGILTITYGPVEKKIYVKKGTIKFAQSNNPRERIGQFLIKYGLITEEILLKALQFQEQEEKSLGDILIEWGMISREQYEDLLETTVREIIYNTFLIEEGNFHFDDRELISNFPYEINLPITDVLFEGFRRLDEWKLIKQVFPSLKARIRFKTPPVSKDPIIRKIYALSQADLNIENMAYELRMSDFELCKVLFNLYRDGKIEVTAAEEEGESDLELVNKLKALKEKLLTLKKEEKYHEALLVAEEMLTLDPSNIELISEIRELRSYIETAHIKPESVPKLRISMDEITSLRVGAKEGFVLSRITGQHSVDQIIKICPFPPAETRRILAKLAKRGIIEVS